MKRDAFHYLQKPLEAEEVLKKYSDQVAEVTAEVPVLYIREGKVRDAQSLLR